MVAIVFFSVVVLFSLALCLLDKINAFNSDNRSVWSDGDGVRVEKGKVADDVKERNLMKRID